MTAYLDHAATTPLCEEARSAMSLWNGSCFGNPSGSHSFARAAREAIDNAREVMAKALGVAAGGIVWTSGGTEADNLAIRGRLLDQPGPVVVGSTEHPAVLEAARWSGCEVREVSVARDGVIDMEHLGSLLDASVSLVSIQIANSETGVVQPFEAIAKKVRRRAPAAVLHTDAVQAMGWLDVASVAKSADLISVSAHKFGGPQGIGVLAVRGDVALAPVLYGGPQERGRRAGTQNVAGIVGAAAAFEVVASKREAETARVGALRDEMETALMDAVDSVTPTATSSRRTPGHCHLVIEGVESEALLVLLDDAGIAASAGSACASGAMEPSHVLLAMGYSKVEALSTLRLTLGHSTTRQDVEMAVSVIPTVIQWLRAGAR